jgi:tRNA(fMet)-specific endonuclease VapC
MYILDTDHLSLLERPDSDAAQRLRKRLEEVPVEEVATTIISYEEQTRGWFAVLAKARTLAAEVEAYRRLSRHLENYRELLVLEFCQEAAVHYQRLKKAKLRVNSMDLKIAAIAFVHADATLLTRNKRDFLKVPDLAVDDWAA